MSKFCARYGRKEEVRSYTSKLKKKEREKEKRKKEKRKEREKKRGNTVVYTLKPNIQVCDLDNRESQV